MSDAFDSIKVKVGEETHLINVMELLETREDKLTADIMKLPETIAWWSRALAEAKLDAAKEKITLAGIEAERYNYAKTYALPNADVKVTETAVSQWLSSDSVLMAAKTEYEEKVAIVNRIGGVVNALNVKSDMVKLLKTCD